MQKISEIKRSSIELTSEVKWLEAEIEYSQLSRSMYKVENNYEKINMSFSEFDDMENRGSDIKAQIDLLDQVDIEIAKTDDIHFQNGAMLLWMTKKQLEIESKRELISFEFEILIWLMVLGILGAGGGLWLSLDGFWRRRKIEIQALGLDTKKKLKRGRKHPNKFILL